MMAIDFMALGGNCELWLVCLSSGIVFWILNKHYYKQVQYRYISRISIIVMKSYVKINKI